jgi:hypothetical protein
MTRHEIDQFAMMQTVDALLINNQSLFQGQPALVAAQAHLRTTINTVLVLAVQALTSGGNTAAKEQQKQKAIDLFLKVQASVLAHATSTSDAKLKEEVTIPESTFKKLRQSDMQTWMQKMYTLAAPIAASLASWGVMQADIEDLKSGADGFRQQLLDLTSTKNLSKEATAAIKSELKAGLDFLNENLDNLMLPYKSLQPTFYTQYGVAREIIDRAATHSKGNDATASGSVATK